MFKYILVTKFVFIYSILLFSLAAQSKVIDPCEFNLISFNGYRIQTLLTGTSPLAKTAPECMIFLQNKSTAGEVNYKRLLWSSTGQFSVYYQEKELTSASQTAAIKAYYFLPQKNKLQLELIDQSRLAVTNVNGVKMTFNTTTARFEEISGVQFTQNMDDSFRNPNWLNIISSEDILIELEYAIGGDPLKDAGADIIVHSPYKPCTSNTYYLFNYYGEEVELKVRTPEQLNLFLKNFCHFSEFNETVQIHTESIFDSTTDIPYR